ncbi:phospholipase A2 inhibitor and Ly6/PLAUR domain-containing protein-like [Rhinophrynus dorsalis]
MSNSAAVLLLLSAVLGEAFSLECFTCNVTSHESLSQCTSSKTCTPEQDRCITITTETNFGVISPASKINYFSKSCGMKSDCDKTFTITAKDVIQTSIISCCDRDKCKPNDVTFPKKNQEKNGVTCPSCNEKNAETCKTTVSMECTGDEKQCASYTFNMKNGTTDSVYTWKGCAKETACNIGNAALLPGAPVTVKTYACSRAPSLLQNMLFPVAYGLVILKLLS